MSVRSDRAKAKQDAAEKAAHTRLLEAQARQHEAQARHLEGARGGEVAGYAPSIVTASRVGEIRGLLEQRRLILVGELEKVEKALDLISGDSRIKELDGLLAHLGI